MTKKDFDLISIKESVISFEPNYKSYFDSVKNSNVPEIEDILANQKDYKHAFDDNGKVNAQYIMAALLVMNGKDADNLYKWGGYWNYIEHYKIYLQWGIQVESLNEAFDYLDVELPFDKSYCYKAMRINKNFKRNEIISLRGKAIHLLPYMEELETDDLAKIISHITPMTDRQAKEFMQSGEYADFLAGRTKEIEYVQKKPKKEKHYDIIFEAPKFKVDRNVVHLQFLTRERQEVGTLAIREIIEDGTFERRCEDIANRKGFEKYGKALSKPIN